MALILLKSQQDVRKWVSPLKLSYSEVCRKFGIDIENDRRNAFFWNMMLDNMLVVNDDLLSWCGYSGEYKTMKNHFLSLFKKNPQFLYDEIEDTECRRKRYIVMDTMDFESLLMQMRSRKAQEIRELYSLLKYISMQYVKYEKYYEEHRDEIISQQNNQLTQSVHELKDLVLQVKFNADREIEKTEEKRRKAEKRHSTVSTSCGSASAPRSWSGCVRDRAPRRADADRSKEGSVSGADMHRARERMVHRAAPAEEPQQGRRCGAEEEPAGDPRARVARTRALGRRRQQRQTVLAQFEVVGSGKHAARRRCRRRRASRGRVFERRHRRHDRRDPEGESRSETVRRGRDAAVDELPECSQQKYFIIIFFPFSTVEKNN
ncbi:unnamed protein product [Euphydryas editha]|uniref:MSV199 domain-containing protein n=1 Tax=Euphydryas editha TaxID=104508 RepID=A0AAU9VF26_EUPED|nr:unnamed protein product [Euphydryas editha]